MANSNLLSRINNSLPEGWEAKLTVDHGRIYYIDHGNQVSSWVPPPDNWDPGALGLPYGWECATDKNNKPYYINHVDKYTTRDDPRDDPDYVEPPKPREIELSRDSQKGFGFVAGSEKPVVVRFVTEGGPSVDKLLPGDQIIKINGEDVKKAPRQYVIDLVRSCRETMTLTVCQPYSDNGDDQSTRKSALLTAAKKAKLKNNPSRVRFAESVTVTMVNGMQSPSPDESYVPFMPNVLKVFLENGQTKSFKYDNKTTVKDVANSLQEKLGIKSVKYFNLVLQNMKSHIPGRLTILQDHETLAEIAARPGARHFRCLFRVMFVPRDAFDLLNEEPMAFEYFYMQCCNDVVQEKFPELKGETVLKLSALQIQQHAMHNNVTGKINIKAIEKECGLEKFVPSTQLESMKGKDLRKLLSQQLKVNQNLTPPGQKQLSALQAKLHYVKIVSELKTFGSRVFMVTLLDQKMEAMVLVGPKSGISLITNIKRYTLSMLADFSEIEKIKVSKEKDNNMQRVEVTVKGKEAGMLNLGLLKDDVQNFVGIVEGYYRIFVDTDACLVEKPASKQTGDPDVPPYTSKHKVLTTPWSYPEDIVSQTLTEQITENERLIDLCQGPPAYEDDEEYINRIKIDLGIKKGEVNEDDAVISLVEEQGTDLVDGTETSINKSVIIIGKRPENNNKAIRRQGPQEGGDIPKSKKPKTSIPELGQNGHVYHNGDIYDEIHDQKTVVSGDELSDTDSGVESERKITLEDPPTPESGVPGGQGDQGGSDTDSWGTPVNNPDKGRAQPQSLPIFDGESFGLHSPDVLPRSESDFQAIASSFGLLSPDKIPPGIEEGILDPRMFSQRQLYIDPDIIASCKSEMIDLTLLPPLEAPNMGNTVSHYGTWSPEMLQSHLHSMGQVEGHPPALVRSASVGDTPDFFDEDIDSLIANLTVPPPPSSVEEGKGTQEEGGQVDAHMPIDESFSDLVIPPPPGESVTALQHIAIVPPIEGQTEADIKMRKRHHRRSSSLDTFFIKFPVEDGGTESCTDPPEDIPPQLPASSPPKLSPSRNPPNELVLPSGGSPPLKDFESPASVSQRLNTLLQSMPIPGEDSQRFSRNTRRTSSLKLSRSSSADTANVVQEAIDSVNAVAVKFGRSNSFQTRHRRRDVDNQGRSPSSHKNGPGISSPGTSQDHHSRRLQRTHSFDVKANKENHDNIWSDSSGSDTSDTLASLKATLKSYRDFLLSKSKDSSRTKDSRRSSISSDEGSEKNGSSLHRSNSFTLGWLKRRSSLSGSDDKGRRSGSDLALNKDQPIRKKEGVEGIDKKTPVLMNQLAVTRSKLKSHSAFSVQEAEHLKEQKGSKKMGPMKALLTASDGQISSCDERRPLEPLRLSLYNKPDPVEITTKDDLSLSVTETSQAKKDLKVSPFGTVGSMWRPMSMSRSSSSSDEPETHTYNNFDLLRDLSTEKVTNKGRTSTKVKQAPVPVPVPSPVRPPRKTTPAPSVSSSVSSSLSSSPTSSINGDIKDSLSEDCFALLRENVSKNHSDSVKHILKRTYSVESFACANEDSDKLLSELKQTMETLKESRIDRQPIQFGMCKEELIGQVKLFVTDAKLLVSNATQTRDKMAKNLNKSMHTLAKIFLHCQATMLMMEAVHQAQHLGFEVIKVTNAYKSTVNAAHAAVGKPLGDPHMRYLMRQATNLATLLSNLLKTLKSLEQK
ncbi:LOW QUALITY PROTEIN: uncharacterized protein LOC117329473 [Pecten maximus]|uniref:LOW QUALITY PROTEIN: uncharacterized protein LOC117329473 n=1 Tax=Pecten maximus TaxID=6579 RepID=UPI0014590E4B|nr:LOW QUALITY PROTEIN: uncharacterized protein LOC117329473 [Pecten maximus]